MDGLFFLLIGPTGVGKTTLIDFITNKFDFINFLPSYTSRAIRKGESYGKPYFFVDKNEFERKIKEDELIEWKFVHGSNYYGIGKAEVEEALTKSQTIITDVEVLGAIDVIEHFPNNCVSIYIDVDSIDEIFKRIKKRGSLTEEEMNQRIKRIELEMLYKYHFNYTILNNNLEECLQDFDRIIDFEYNLRKYRVSRPPSSVLHYVITAIVVNSENKILLHQKKSPIKSNNWKILRGHALTNESPKDALYRELHFICPSLSQKEKNILAPLKPFSTEKVVLQNHFHHELRYRIHIDLPSIQSENYNFIWASENQCKEYLNTYDFQLIETSRMLF